MIPIMIACFCASAHAFGRKDQCKTLSPHSSERDFNDCDKQIEALWSQWDKGMRQNEFKTYAQTYFEYFERTRESSIELPEEERIFTGLGLDASRTTDAAPHKRSKEALSRCAKIKDDPSPDKTDYTFCRKLSRELMAEYADASAFHYDRMNKIKRVHRLLMAIYVEKLEDFPIKICCRNPDLTYREVYEDNTLLDIGVIESVDFFEYITGHTQCHYNDCWKDIPEKSRNTKIHIWNPQALAFMENYYQRTLSLHTRHVLSCLKLREKELKDNKRVNVKMQRTCTPNFDE
ncbi:hypothetical protein ACFL6Y_01965 [Elusimicrobiota bacterium]